jgi:hypothetical protein
MSRLAASSPTVSTSKRGAAVGGRGVVFAIAAAALKEWCKEKRSLASSREDE